jgi:hypothetical protein
LSFSNSRETDENPNDSRVAFKQRITMKRYAIFTACLIGVAVHSQTTSSGTQSGTSVQTTQPGTTTSPNQPPSSSIINEPSGAIRPLRQTQIQLTNQVSVNRANTNAVTNDVRLGGRVISDPSGAARTPGIGSSAATDASFTQRLREALIASGTDEVFSRQNMSGITVSSQNGVVTLRGAVKNEGQKRSIESRLRQMQGVTAVNNQLVVSSTAGEDANIQTPTAPTPPVTPAVPPTTPRQP